MAEIARDQTLDSSLALLREGYEFISNRCRRYDTDAFETRLMSETAVCVQGEEAASVFYDATTRKRAMPRTVLELLQDLGSVQVLDGEAHRHRKGMFMSLMSREGIARLATLTAQEWRAAIDRWEGGGEVVLSQEAEEILCRAVCAWAGVPLAGSEAAGRARDLGRMFDGAGSIGSRQVRGRLARRRGEDWIQDVVRGIRAGDTHPAEGDAAHTIAWHRERNGELLDQETAAVEILNVLRPTVAVARYVTFAALAVHDHPDCRHELQSGGDAALRRFVQEVRRFYPLFPLVGGRVTSAFEWRGHHFPRGRWMLLDIYGTNRDPRLWERPDEFRPQRFGDWSGSPFAFIPQGGGDHYEHHRCAGEWITIELTKVALRALTDAMSYDVPDQDLHIRLSRMPAVPNSGFVIRDVRSSRG